MVRTRPADDNTYSKFYVKLRNENLYTSFPLKAGDQIVSVNEVPSFNPFSVSFNKGVRIKCGAGQKVYIAFWSDVPEPGTRGHLINRSNRAARITEAEAQNRFSTHKEISY